MSLVYSISIMANYSLLAWSFNKKALSSHTKLELILDGDSFKNLVESDDFVEFQVL
jgi:hypothetical protein